jgi:hypothetical protein
MQDNFNVKVIVIVQFLMFQHYCVGLSLSVRPFVYHCLSLLFVLPSVCFSRCFNSLAVCSPTCLPACLSLSVCQSVCISACVCLSVCLSVCLCGYFKYVHLIVIITSLCPATIGNVNSISLSFCATPSLLHTSSQRSSFLRPPPTLPTPPPHFFFRGV